MTRKHLPGLKYLIPAVLRSVIESELCQSRTISNVHLVHHCRSSVHASSWSQMVLYSLALGMDIVMKSHLESHCLHVFSEW